jgi:molybdate transport system regulatory protein
MAKRRLQAHLEVETNGGAFLGDARIRLLEAVDRLGSISKAARQVPMSYKTAWDALDDLDNLADHPVIARSAGGVGGGGTKLTDYGRQLVAMFRAVEGQYQSAIDALHTAPSPEAFDQPAFQQLLRRVTLRTSARNQFACSVARIQSGVVSAQVFLSLDDDCEIEAQITTDSVRELGLAAGQEVVALVKAPAVFLLSDTTIRTSVNNHLTGVVSRIQNGALNAEVVLDLPLKRVRHVTAIVTMQAVAALGLKVGSPATAAFQATSLILMMFA